jgi:hypothetical protein
VALAERLFNVTLDGQTYTARVVRDEPSGHLIEPPMYIDDTGKAVHGEPRGLDEGPFEPAVRVGGTTDRAIAIRVLAAACGFDYDRVKDWGAYGDPVWTDPRNGEIVFWTTCTPD